jgi:hypothetical protein
LDDGAVGDGVHAEIGAAGIEAREQDGQVRHPGGEGDDVRCHRASSVGSTGGGRRRVCGRARWTSKPMSWT